MRQSICFPSSFSSSSSPSLAHLLPQQPRVRNRQSGCQVVSSGNDSHDERVPLSLSAAVHRQHPRRIEREERTGVPGGGRERLRGRRRESEGRERVRRKGRRVTRRRLHWISSLARVSPSLLSSVVHLLLLSLSLSRSSLALPVAVWQATFHLQRLFN